LNLLKRFTSATLTSFKNLAARFSNTIPSDAAKKARTWVMKCFSESDRVFPLLHIIGEINLLSCDRKHNRSRNYRKYQQKFYVLRQKGTKRNDDERKYESIIYKNMRSQT